MIFVSQVPRVFRGDLTKLDDEWRELPRHRFSGDMKNIDIVQFYTKVTEEGDVEGLKLFGIFGTFAMHILALSTSNADAERVFSKLNQMK